MSDESGRATDHEDVEEELEAAGRVFERTADEFQEAVEDEDLSGLGGFAVSRKLADTFNRIAERSINGGGRLDEVDEREEWPTVECGVCDDPVSLKVAKSGWGRNPVHPDCFDAGDRDE